MPQATTHPTKYLVIRITHQLLPDIFQMRSLSCSSLLPEALRSYRFIILLKIAHPSHLLDNLLHIFQIDNFFTPCMDPFAEHLRNPVFNIFQYLLAFGGVTEMLFDINHIRSQYVVGIFFNMEYNAVDIYNDCLVHDCV